MLDRGVGSFRFAGGVIVAEREGGVTAYAPHGTLHYRVEEPLQIGVVSTTGPYVYVPATDTLTLVVELATGRVLGRPVAATPFQELDTW